MESTNDMFGWFVFVALVAAVCCVRLLHLLSDGIHGGVPPWILISVDREDPV